ncbi:unnamed protein product [Auanema sp. JU1783]|nr:unnamed protein product [Auanema sp. JU1783]
MRLILLLSLIIPLISAQAPLFDYGQTAGDQLIPYSDQQHAVSLEIPVVFLENPQDELFISSTGIVSFGEKIPDTITPLQRLNRSSIAVYYAPIEDSVVYYRSTTSDQNLLKKLSEYVRSQFADGSEFQTLQAIIITWDEVINKENDGHATFQLAIASDGIVSYSILMYKNLPWSSSAGIYAQAGFTGPETFHALVNSGGPDVKRIENLSNHSDGTYFIFRISGSAFEDPKENAEEYDYGTYDQDYDGEQRKPPQDCPIDSYSEKCPERCNNLVDDRGCTRCICAEPESGEETDEITEEIRQSVPLEPARNSNRGDESEEFPSSCDAAGETACHQFGECRDQNPGYCCVCQPGYYGNGKECLKKGDPQRISGFFEAVLNGKAVEKTDLHTFITPTDGHAFTAVSKIPSDLASPMLLLLPVGSVMGWLFAEVQSTEAYNGFMLTGGLFNRTVTLHIGDRYYVTIKQEFSGRDIYHYLKANVFVSGTLPDISPDAEVVYPDYEEEYRKEGNGFIRSYTSMDVLIRDNGQESNMRLTIDQQINFKECPFKSFDKPQTVKLSVKRVHVTYDANEGIVRYASRNHVGLNVRTAEVPSSSAHFDRRQHGQTVRPASRPVQISEGVCAHGAHVCTSPHMRCIPWEQTYRCVCEEGFQAKADTASPIGWGCEDIDECNQQQVCGHFADCTNSPGGYSCSCQEGYTGDGRTCSRIGEVESHPAQPRHHHVEASSGAGAGGICTNHRQCHQFGECSFTPGNPSGICKCRGWYVGDGVNHCGPPEENSQPRHNANIPMKSGKACGRNICDQNAECMPATSGGSECVCNVGYVGNGINCESLIDDNSSSAQETDEETIGSVCRSHEECHDQGRCAYNHQLGYYQCVCAEPYIGNGVECHLPSSGSEIDIPLNNPSAGCDVTRDCDTYADCIFERTVLGGNYKCVCQSGYSGDGKYCSKTEMGNALPPLEQPGCDRLRNCHQNAQCTFDSHNQKYRCECHEGYVGDGLSCVKIHSGTPNWEGGTPARPMRCRESTECHQNGHCVASINENDYICECLPGYRGDGVNKCQIADMCNPADPSACHQNAECVYGTTESAYVCKCVTGFTGDGVTCLPYARPSTCIENPRMCHANAQCVLNKDQSSYVCICKPGSIGDGYNHCTVQDTPRCSNCSMHGHCSHNSVSGGYQCKCNAGYEGNGHICALRTSCLDDRSICDEHAECVPGEGGHYVCNCLYGFHGNGRTCKPDSEDRGDSLFIARGMAIFQRGTMADVPGKQIIVIPHHIAVGLDFDCEAERLVWSDISGHQIRSASLNGSDQSAFLSADLNSPEGIAVDWASRNVYYADSLNDEIGVASLDGKYKKSLVTEGLVNPRSVALDLHNKQLYYTDWHRENPLIGRVDMDGKNNKIFLNEDVHLPNGLTVLPNRRELCWVDAGSHRLSCIGFDGQHRRVVYAPLEYPFGLTHENEQRFYWTDWRDNRIHTVGVYGDGYSSFPVSLGGSGKVYGIISIPKTCTAPPTACSENNGGCKHLCLPSKEGVTCVCPDNVAVKGC